MKTFVSTLAFLSCWAVVVPWSAAAGLQVTASHSLATARPSETIVVPWARVKAALPDAEPDKLVIRDAAGRTLVYQFTNFDPASTSANHARNGSFDDILFQYSFAAGERSAVFTLEQATKSVPPVLTTTFARYVPERLDDFAFENDRLGHRMYGPALDTPAAGQSRMISSGIDVWCKRVGYPIIDRWYLRGHDSYHADNGEGLDFYSVGTGRGCGGSGIWDGQQLFVSHNWATWKVLANGPVRTVFELGYAPWPAGAGVTVAETKRFTIDAGRSLHRVESTFVITGAREVTVALGLGKHKNVPATLDRNAGGWLALWEKYPKPAEGELGTAVMLASGAFQGFAEDSLNQLALTKAVSGQSLAYYLGAGWSRGSEITSAERWTAYLADFARRARAPITVKVEVAP